ncbi:uncharacterized protein LOC121557001 [Coregonus clupeaformis]|uniref:uncharacterized protein LOC121557001 n=1 Tax=Coregonus clupeaformis TaxID=59861 RepID=UPI001E1C586B|nr:uncharacterized protein LOC121557001 [Coregonus clupeaformis]
MDRFREVSASEKERKPAWEESEEASSTSSGIWTLSDEECRDLETEISWPEEKLRFMKRLLAVPALLLTSLEEMNPHELKTFQSNLTSVQLPGCPPIPESQLENADRQVTVDQMVKTYGPERAVEITLRILRGMDQNYLAKKLKRDYNRALLLATLEELTGEQLKTFQSKLTSVQLPGFPPIPECQLENADRQVIVGQMVKRYGPESAVGKTQRILRGMDQNDLAEKLERDYRHRRETSDADSDEESENKLYRRKWHRALVMKEEAASEMERKPAGEESGELPSTSSGMLTLSGEKRLHLKTEISRMKENLRFMKRPSMLDVPVLLLTTLEELTGEQLKTFQSYLIGEH